MLRRYRDAVADAPDELTTILTLRTAPPAAYLPPELHGRPVVIVGSCWAGDLERGERAVEPLRRLGRPLFDALAPRPYVEHQGMLDAAVPHGWHYYWKSCELPPLSDGAVDALVEHAGRNEAPGSYVIVFHLGGAVACVGEDETAYGQRDAAHNVNINAVWLPEEEAVAGARVRWARDTFAAVDRHSTGRAYVNFLGDEGQERVRAAYGARRYERLVALKRRWDPDNVLRLNQNVDPRGLDSAA